MSKTTIEWTERTWNPVRGCSPVSPGCAHCYAEKTAGRFCGPGKPFDGFVQIGKNGQPGPHWTGKVDLIEHMLGVPLRTRKPTTWFVNSMSDLFHENLSECAILRVFSTMQKADWHTYQILTKRSERMREITEWIGRKFADEGLKWPLPNVWLGVSVEDQPRADERIPDLLLTPAAVRFISAEPLLGGVDIQRFLSRPETANRHTGSEHSRTDGEVLVQTAAQTDTGQREGRSEKRMEARREPSEVGIDWVIVGGESGPGARPFDIRWPRSIVRQCQDADVPVFVKQMGAAPTCSQDPIYEGRPFKLKDRKGGDMDEWPGDLRVRQMPEVVERPRFVR